MESHSLTIEEESLLAGASSFSSETEKLAIYELIQQQITRQEEIIRAAENKIRTWKYRRNGMSNISRLPSEILLKIFLLIIMSHSPIKPDAFSKTSHNPNPNIRHCFNAPQWATMSHVCRWWRDLMLNSPSLWNRDTSISIELNFFNHQSEELQQEEELAFQNLDRACELHVYERGYPLVLGPSRAEDIREYLKSPAPLVKSFKIWTRSPSNNLLPPNLFSGRHPELRHLILRNWALQLEESCIKPLSGITSLDLSHSLDISSPLKAKPSLFLAALRWLPNLLSLRTENSFIDPDGYSDSDQSACSDLDMRHLLDIELEETPQVSLFILSHVSMPAIAYTRVKQLSSNGVRSAADSTHPMLMTEIAREITGRSRQDPLVFMYLSYTSTTGISSMHMLGAKQLSAITRPELWPKRPDVSLVYEAPEAQQELSVICLLSVVQALDMMILSAPINQEGWTSLSRSGSLWKLIMDGKYDLHHLIRRLSYASIEQEARINNQFLWDKIPFRGLLTLQISPVLYGEPDQSEPSQIQLRQLFECIKVRRECGLGPKRLEMHNYTTIPKQIIPDLEKCVQVVIH